MNIDPLLAPIREARHRISAEFNHDPRRLVAYYMERQRKLIETGERKFYEPSTSREPESELLLHDRPPKPPQH